jgi:ketosteroid isomerase-like protein
MKLESLFEIYKNAVFQKDVEAFTSIFDENIQVFDMWEWTYDGLGPWQQMAKEWFSSLGTERVNVTFDDIRIQTTGEMGVASAFMKFTALSEKNEELRSLQNRLTWVARKKDDVWKIIHEHTSGPADGETMKVILKR